MGPRGDAANSVDHDASAAEEESAAPRVSEGVRLLATQMSVAGSDPDEIARRLRDEFGV